MDDLPGFADGVSSNRKGVFWIAFFTVRNPVIDRFHPHPWAKGLLAKLPKFLWPKPAPYGFVAAADEEGRWLASYHDPGGQHVQEVTSVEEDGAFLYLGTLKGRGIARWRKTQEW
jgi:sugar lactone lactonase YvrE